MEKDGQLTIIDYKTDRENNPSLLESHYRRQLSVYADAAESILQKPVVSLLLCLSIWTGRPCQPDLNQEKGQPIHHLLYWLVLFSCITPSSVPESKVFFYYKTAESDCADDLR